jgi:putative lipoic acid-binding regulatory protein
MLRYFSVGRVGHNHTAASWLLTLAVVTVTVFATRILAWVPAPAAAPCSRGVIVTISVGSKRKSAPAAALFVANNNNKAGTYFNPVPRDDDDDDDETGSTSSTSSLETSVEELLRRRKAPPSASQPSTIHGLATAQVRPGQVPSSSSSFKFMATATTTSLTTTTTTTNKKKSFVGIGPPLNDLSNPAVDDQGYTLYADETTGHTARVFEALVEYPCQFDLKIVGANDKGAFVPDMLLVVAESCQVPVADLIHRVRTLGKWTSVTVQAPVQSADMLYRLYETIDRDPRVKFKF